MGCLQGADKAVKTDLNNTKKIAKTLLNIFKKEKQRIVFWNDPEGEFAHVIHELELEDVKILRLDEYPPLEIKILLEIKDRTNCYLLYDPKSEPLPEDDWLLDICLYSHTLLLFQRP